MVRPIPKKLLPHSITVEKAQKDDGWGSEHGEPVVISHVRVEPKASLKNGGTSYGSDTNDVIFIDAVNSDPFFIIDVKDKVNGRSVNKVNEHWEFDKIHHLEVELI